MVPLVLGFIEIIEMIMKIVLMYSTITCSMLMNLIVDCLLYDL